MLVQIYLYMFQHLQCPFQFKLKNFKYALPAAATLHIVAMLWTLQHFTLGKDLARLRSKCMLTAYFIRGATYDFMSYDFIISSKIEDFARNPSKRKSYVSPHVNTQPKCGGNPGGI